MHGLTMEDGQLHSRSGGARDGWVTGEAVLEDRGTWPWGGGENSAMASWQRAEGGYPAWRCAKGEGMLVKMKCDSVGERRIR